MPSIAELKRIKETLQATHAKAFAMFIAPKGATAMVESGAMDYVLQRQPVPDDLFDDGIELDLYFIRLDRITPAKDGRGLPYDCLSSGGIPKP